jgi:hypothetical protein
MRVNLSGMHFVDYGDVRARWGGGTWTRATVVSPTQITTLSPENFSHAAAQDRLLAPVEVSLNGVTWSAGTTAFFTFYDLGDTRVSLLTPGGGPTQGNTRVTVSGSALRGPGYRGHAGALPASSGSFASDSAHVACLWCAEGDAACRAACARPGECASKVAGSWVGPEAVVCDSPPAAAAGAHTLELSFDSHEFTSLHAP